MAQQKIHLFEQIKDVYIGTQAGIEALAGVIEGAVAYATDRDAYEHFGTYNGASWEWDSVTGAGVASVTGDGVDNTDPANPVISYPTPADIGAATSAQGALADTAIQPADLGSAAYEDTTAFDPAGAAVAAAATAQTNAAIYSDAVGADAKSYADGLVVGLWDDRGSFDASGGAYPSSGGSGTAGAILKGDIWTISVAGTLPTGQVVEVGDVVRALVNTPGNTQANWAITQNNIGYVAENSANKATTMTGNETSNILYLTAKAVYDWAVGLFQPLDSDLTAFAGLSPSNDDILQRKAGAWTNRTLAQLITDITENIQDVVGAMMQAIGGMSITYNDTTGKIEFLVDTDSIGAIPLSGWRDLSSLVASITYASATTINVPSGADNTFEKAYRIRWKQTGDTNYRYGILKTVASTLLTTVTNSDFVVANAAFTEFWYSPLEEPWGFPRTFNFAPTLSGTGFTLSNGTVAGKYRIHADGHIRWTGSYAWGNADTLGTASLNFTNPATIATPEDAYRGTGVILDSGTIRFEAFVETGATSVSCYAFDASSTYGKRSGISSTVPMTWAAGDKLTFEADGWLA